MKNKFLIILVIFILLTVCVGYMVYNYRSQIINSQKISKEYESYYHLEMLGTELMSIINRTIDINTKGNVPKDENGYFTDNQKDSIHIYIKFVYKDKQKTIQMEDIEKNTSEAFIRNYSTASFKCTDIQYHEKTKNVKSLTFEEIEEQ